MPDVAAAAGALNKALKEQTDDYHRGLRTLISTLDIILRSLQLLRSQQVYQEEQTVSAEYDPAAIEQGLDDLLRALDQDDLDRIEMLLEEMKGHFPEPQLTLLNRQVADFEFRAAEDTLKKLAAHLKIDPVHRNKYPSPKKRGEMSDPELRNEEKNSHR
jgi:hypothetical protein